MAVHPGPGEKIPVTSMQIMHGFPRLLPISSSVTSARGVTIARVVLVLLNSISCQCKICSTRVTEITKFLSRMNEALDGSSVNLIYVGLSPIPRLVIHRAALL